MTPLLDAVMQEQELKQGAAITSTTVYSELVPEANTKKNVDNAGVKALKQFHLKTPDAYER